MLSRPRGPAFPMERIPEFFGNHLLLFAAFFAVLGMLIYTEWMRVKAGNTALSPFAATRLLNDGNALVVGRARREGNTRPGTCSTR